MMFNAPNILSIYLILTFNNPSTFVYNFIFTAKMGIEGLLKFLDPVTLKEHISTFRNQRAAIDIMSWIYKGCYRCAYEHNQNIESNAFLYYILQMLDLLSFYNIKPICVFDGRYVGKKDQTIEKRRKAKQQNRQKGLYFLEIGNQQEARKFLSRCIIIDQRIISLTIKALHTKGIEYMVAPYQSDSQIAKLLLLDLADFAITEDSDLVVYNAKVVLKLSQDGQCDYIDLLRWKPSDADSLYLKLYLQMSAVNRIQSAILAGCDYNSSIKGIGIKKAIKHLTQRKTMNAVIEHLKERKPFCERIPQKYSERVLHSKLIFMLATVFNPLQNKLQFLNPVMVDQIKPQDLDLQQLKQIVGPFYDYNKEARLGKINVKNSQLRIIQKIDIKSVFQINPSNLIIRQNANMKRREIFRVQRQKRQQEKRLLAQSGQQAVLVQKPKKTQKNKAPVVQLTEEQKKQQREHNKAERIRRFEQFKNMLNSFVIQQSSESQSSQQSSIFREENEKSQEKLQSNKKSNITKLQDEDQQKIYQSEVEDKKSESAAQINFESLNPWAKY